MMPKGVLDCHHLVAVLVSTLRIAAVNGCSNLSLGSSGSRFCRYTSDAIALIEDPVAPPSRIHLGFRSGLDAPMNYLSEMEDAGVIHVALNLRFNKADIADTLNRLADAMLPRFATGD